jgi:hypothetical protein
MSDWSRWISYRLRPIIYWSRPMLDWSQSIRSRPEPKNGDAVSRRLVERLYLWRQSAAFVPGRPRRITKGGNRLDRIRSRTKRRRPRRSLAVRRARRRLLSVRHQRHHGFGNARRRKRSRSASRKVTSSSSVRGASINGNGRVGNCSKSMARIPGSIPASF